jgi:CRISPR-associated endonuclease Cas1
MNADDTLYGRIKNGVLNLSGNNASIRVDGGCLVVSDGPTAVAANHEGKAPSLEERMTTLRLRRADCPIKRIVVTRPDGFITFGAIKWLHGVGASLVQLDWDGTVLLTASSCPSDQPALRRAQALAAGSENGHTIAREILRMKLSGQAQVARLLCSVEVSELITRRASDLDDAPNTERLLIVEATAALAYWSLWVGVPLHFARRHQVPEHWRTFGGRHSPLTAKPLKAASPGNAILNYLYAVAVGEMTIALTAAGLDPGLGILHADRERRASLAYDAIEVVRPYVDGWLLAWLATAHFSKRDFYEEADGVVRLTRPLTSHLAMTAAIWRPAAETVAGWLARGIGGGLDRKRRLPAPLPALPAPRRTWQGLELPVDRACRECGKMLSPKRPKFCSDACSIAFHIATTTTELKALPAFEMAAGRPADSRASARGGSRKNGQNLALRRAWDAQFSSNEPTKPRTRNTLTRASGPAVDQLQEWFKADIAPQMATCPVAEIRRATGLSKHYAIMIRQGYIPHPRHYPMLAELVGAVMPTLRGVGKGT